MNVKMAEQSPAQPEKKRTAYSKRIVLTSKLIELILNYRPPKRKTIEPLARIIEKFIKEARIIADPEEYMNLLSTNHDREEYKRLTPLMAACLVKNVDVTRVLVKNGAELTLIPSLLGMELSYAMLSFKSPNSRERKSREELISIMIDMMTSNPTVCAFKAN